jgi:hybrid cluster-associated redox disulfide protein
LAFAHVSTTLKTVNFIKRQNVQFVKQKGGVNMAVKKTKKSPTVKSKSIKSVKPAKKASLKTPAKKESSKKAAKKIQASVKVTKQMLIGEVVRVCPESAEIMFKYGLHCLGCGMVAYESLEQGSQAHGLSEKEIDKMVQEINTKLRK